MTDVLKFRTRWLDAPQFDGLLVLTDPRFGGSVDGATNNDAAWTAIIDAAGDARDAGRQVRIVVPGGAGALIQSPVAIPTGIDVDQRSPLLWDGDTGVAALTVGEAGSANLSPKLRLWVQRVVQSGWTTDDDVGIRLLGTNAGDIRIVQAFGFSVGVECNGAGTGFSYNALRLGYLRNNRVQLLLTNESSGWCNENDFYGGRFAVASAINVGTPRYGVVLSSKDLLYVNNNNNVFFKPSFELQAASGAVAIRVEHGHQNHWERIRSENNAVTLECLNAAYENTVTIGYEGAGITQLVDTSSSYGTNMVTSSRVPHFQACTLPVFDSGDLIANYSPYSATAVFVRGVGLGTSSNATIAKTATSIAPGTDYLDIPSTRSIGVMIDTSELKEFVIYRRAVSGRGGRVLVRAYDASGTVLTSSDPNHPYVRTAATTTFNYQTSYGGGHRTASDANTPVYFKVGADVKKVWVAITGGTASAQLYGFSIFTRFPHAATPSAAPRVWAGYSDPTESRFIASQSPETSGVGTWPKGAQVWNGDPDSTEAAGWVCTVAGSPGTWKSFGTIA